VGAAPPNWHGIGRLFRVSGCRTGAHADVITQCTEVTPAWRHTASAQEIAIMGNRNFQPHAAVDRRAPWLPASHLHTDIRKQLLQALQRFFEVSRDQFDDADLGIPEWRQADDALERAYDACAAREAVATVEKLCLVTRRYIGVAVEMSTARSYYDGRL
jgi:hypothetical protein